MKDEAVGRYITFLLPEVISEYPSALKAIFPTLGVFNPTKYDIVPELTLPKLRKRPDITVVNRRDSSRRPLALIEIKYRDDATKATSQQIREYIRFCKKSDIEFLYITQFDDINYSDRALFQTDTTIRHISYAALHKMLIEDKTRSIAIRLFCEYLAENTAMFDKVDDDKALKLLMIRSLNFAQSQKLGRLYAKDRMLIDVPAVFARLLGNISALSEYVFYQIDGDYFRQIPTTQYTFESEIAKSELRNELKINANKDRIWIDSKRIRSGQMSLYSDCKIKTRDKSDWLYLRFGFYIYLDTTLESEEALSTACYADVRGKDIKLSTREETSDSLDELGTTARTTISVIRKSLKKALKVSPSRYRPSLRRILKKTDVVRR